jgi:phosphoesterase RecJ-like protein
MSSLQPTNEVRRVAEALRAHDRFLVTTHENPDGDALGSLLALELGLAALGKDVRTYLYGDVPLPAEYSFMALRQLRRTLPEDVERRVLVAVDCANESRLGSDAGALERAWLTIDIDHHHDNTRFGDLNLIVPEASSTGEIVRDVLRELGVELTPEIAEAIYIALVTDTGRFQYTNTTPRALRLAAELVEAGADVHRVFQDVYESVQFAKLKLLARALDRAQIYEGGRLVVSHLLRHDFSDVGAVEPYSEGIIDYLRAVEGAQMAVLIRERPHAPNGPARKVSLRSSADEIDVSAIARKSGGGGHRQAAGFSSDASIDEVTEFVRREFAALMMAESGSSSGPPRTTTRSERTDENRMHGARTGPES